MDESILLVEDEPADAALLLRALKQVDLRVPTEVVRDGRSALDFLLGLGEHANRAKAPLPTLVILDLKLPKLGGLEVLAQIHASARLQKLSVIVLSSSAQPEDIAQANKLGVQAYLVKPTEHAGYRNVALEILGHWQRQVEQS